VRWRVAHKGFGRGAIRGVARPPRGERYDRSSADGNRVGPVGVLRSALVELGDDRLSEAAQEAHVALAQLWGPSLS
jgi:hypothetical protein